MPADPGDPADEAPRSLYLLESVTLLVSGLTGLLSEWDPAASLRATADADEALGARPDLLVCGPSGLASLTGRYLEHAGSTPATVAVVLRPADVDYAAVLACGIEVLWDAGAPASTFPSAAEAALRRESWVSESLTGWLTSDIGTTLRRDREAAGYGLTNREIEVLRLLATGMSNQEIGARLFISRNTVKNHVRALLDKLQAASRTEAVVIGARLGLVDVSQRPTR